jgi:hypothetical protein
MCSTILVFLIFLFSSANYRNCLYPVFCWCKIVKDDVRIGSCVLGHNL